MIKKWGRNRKAPEKWSGAFAEWTGIEPIDNGIFIMYTKCLYTYIYIYSPEITG